MAEKSVEDYLRLWNLEAYIEKFREHSIDLNGLQVLSQDDIKDLVPSIGHRALLTAQIKALKNVINSPPSNSLAIEQTTGVATGGVETFYVNPANSSLSHLLNDSLINSLPMIDDGLHLQEEEAKCLYNYLNSTNEGRALLLQFGESGLLDNTARRRLCNIIIGRELKDDPDCKIDSARFYQLAYEITQVFKKELSTVYFIPYVRFSPGLKTAEKGKLLDCYRHRRREFSKSGLIKSRKRSASESSSCSSATSSCTLKLRVEEAADKLEDPSCSSGVNIEECMLWLQNSCDPWDTVEKFLDLTAKARFKKNSEESMTINEYYNRFRALGQASGIYLLLKDFTTLYPGCDDLLYNHWPLYRGKILDLARNRIRIDPHVKEILLCCTNNADEDTLNTAAFMVLPFLMSTATIRRAKTKKQWRPSRLEAQEGFITHVRSADQLEDTITRRKKKLTELGFTLQPYIVIVGASISEIHEIYIVINDVKYCASQCVRYRSTSIIHAVDS
ncbi:unnamed protein product [Euphydryas editha]|uniref:SAM domain-containing protein n=1 Tax=Euphydryas editha TaxID=104508 RepID=A0AAU9UVQ5_EUPED|nr:unnamed protein product [Euphydryas editha]